ncbi:hypothetical protein, partial [Micromonospora sp. NPDC007230]|uniref:DUF7668 domain-containing protein n=1 Tax=Micromonospora sp. NPDC007230 TaxID=3364237 RepID=UPI003676C800
DGSTPVSTADRIAAFVRVAPINPYALLRSPHFLADHDAWKVNVDLWSREEGRSDMTLQVTVWEEAGAIKLTIDDLHAL